MHAAHSSFAMQAPSSTPNIVLRALSVYLLTTCENGHNVSYQGDHDMRGFRPQAEVPYPKEIKRTECTDVHELEILKQNFQTWTMGK